MTQWTLASRAAKMNSSAIREILKLTDRPGIISMAGGLPSPQTFPISAFQAACNTVLERDGAAALQYSTTEGLPALRQAVADFLPWDVDPEQVLIVSGSQQALDLIGKIFLDKDSRVLVERPTYLGALQAFAPMEPIAVGVASDDQGMLVDDFAAQAGSGAGKARFAYVLPNFQNPTGRTMSEERRQALVDKARELDIPLIEDNPYGDLRFEGEAPLPLAARNPEGVLYMGSFSKVLAPGLRLGFVVAPKSVYGKLVQAKQAADLHTPSFNQRVVAEVMKDGFLDRHIPTIRTLYKNQRDAMLAALDQEMVGLGVSWTRPVGGMFLGATARRHGCAKTAAPGGGARHGLCAWRPLLPGQSAAQLPAPVVCDGAAGTNCPGHRCLGGCDQSLCAVSPAGLDRPHCWFVAVAQQKTPFLAP